ncbi:DUF1330 domain-containing protein [Agaribacter marinus]|uniref:DUF1330 domain-containing protein n=1 Tax=Agaribacter marinus TaxID=1431249 RepID=A0AA37SY15_9ALTE|nr:DUF1330 domain-containing protein [Agaribacter marinus]GLR69821.1 hypothetical protein GCM10007852_07290 [Agaribacter marinus]
MTAYVVVDLNVNDAEKLAQYSALAAKSIAEYKGEFIAKSPITVLHGGNDFTTKVIIQFPDKGSAEAWYNSHDYQGIIAIRDQAMNSQFHLLG